MGGGTVGQDHVHYKALTKIFLVKVVELLIEGNKSHNYDCIVITATADAKGVTTTHHHHSTFNYSITVEIL